MNVGSAGSMDGSKEGVLDSGRFLGAEAVVKRHPGIRKLECVE